MRIFIIQILDSFTASGCRDISAAELIAQIIAFAVRDAGGGAADKILDDHSGAFGRLGVADITADEAGTVGFAFVKTSGFYNQTVVAA